MPPPKASRATAHDDSSFDPIAATKAKIAAHALTSGRGRRNGAGATTNGTSLKEVMSSNDLASQVNGNGSAFSNSGGIQWSTEDPTVLQNYRRAYRLSTPSAFKNPMAVSILNSGIGKNSPTMSRAKTKRRISKEQLALAVRKNFNAQPVNENEAVVELLYRIRMKDKTFRMKFPATKPNK